MQTLRSEEKTQDPWTRGLCSPWQVIPRKEGEHAGPESEPTIVMGNAFVRRDVEGQVEH